MAKKDAKEPDKKEEAEETEGQEQPKGGGKKKLFIIIGAVVGLLVLGGVGMMFMGGSAEHAEEEVEDTEKHYGLLELDTIIVNLSDSSSFLKVKMSLQYDPTVIERAANKAHGGGGASGGGEGSGGPPLFTERGSMMRDSIIKVLSSKTSAEVLSSSGKETIKEELLRAINEALGLEEDVVVNIYFDEFLVQ